MTIELSINLCNIIVTMNHVTPDELCRLVSKSQTSYAAYLLNEIQSHTVLNYYQRNSVNNVESSCTVSTQSSAQTCVQSSPIVR